LSCTEGHGRGKISCFQPFYTNSYWCQCETA
jgi:hypothetical protein